MTPIKENELEFAQRAPNEFRVICSTDFSHMGYIAWSDGRFVFEPEPDRLYSPSQLLELVYKLGELNNNGKQP